MYRRFKKGEWETQMEDGSWMSIDTGFSMTKGLEVERLEEAYREYYQRIKKETRLVGGRHDWEVHPQRGVN